MPHGMGTTMFARSQIVPEIIKQISREFWLSFFKHQLPPNQSKTQSSSPGPIGPDIHDVIANRLRCAGNTSYGISLLLLKTKRCINDRHLLNISSYLYINHEHTSSYIFISSQMQYVDIYQLWVIFLFFTVCSSVPSLKNRSFIFCPILHIEIAITPKVTHFKMTSRSPLGRIILPSSAESRLLLFPSCFICSARDTLGYNFIAAPYESWQQHIDWAIRHEGLQMIIPNIFILFSEEVRRQFIYHEHTK